MTTLTPEDVMKLARLARLELNDAEIKKYSDEITAILGFVDKLQNVDTEGLEPTYQVSGRQNIMRADKVVDYGTNQASLLKNVPHTEKDLIKVGRMVG